MAEWEPFDRRNGGYNLPSDIYPEYSSNKNGQQPNDSFLGTSSELAQNHPCYASINPTGSYINASDYQPRLSDRFRPDVRRVSRDGDPQAVSFLYGCNRASPVGRGRSGGGLPSARFGFDHGGEGHHIPSFCFDYGGYGPNGIGQDGGGFESSLFPPRSQAWSYDNAGFYGPMNRRIGTAKLGERMQLNKFLRPGALARMRDSRMVRSRSPKSTAKFASLPTPSSPEESRVGVVVLPQVADLDRLSSFFAARSSGPRFVQRKKLLASKEIIFKNPSVVVAVGIEGVDTGLISDFLLTH